MPGCERRIDPRIILIIYSNSQTFIAKDQDQPADGDEDGDGDDDGDGDEDGVGDDDDDGKDGGGMMVTQMIVKEVTRCIYRENYYVYDLNIGEFG